jgi:hypothetical protein
VSFMCAIPLIKSAAGLDLIDAVRNIEEQADQCFRQLSLSIRWKRWRQELRRSTSAKPALRHVTNRYGSVRRDGQCPCGLQVNGTAVAHNQQSGKAAGIAAARSRCKDNGVDEPT